MKNTAVSLFTTVLIIAVLSVCSSNTSQTPSAETKIKLIRAPSIVMVGLK